MAITIDDTVPVVTGSSSGGFGGSTAFLGEVPVTGQPGDLVVLACAVRDASNGVLGGQIDGANGEGIPNFRYLYGYTGNTTASVALLVSRLATADPVLCYPYLNYPTDSQFDWFVKPYLVRGAFATWGVTAGTGGVAYSGGIPVTTAIADSAVIAVGHTVDSVGTDPGTGVVLVGSTTFAALYKAASVGPAGTEVWGSIKGNFFMPANAAVAEFAPMPRTKREQYLLNGGAL